MSHPHGREPIGVNQPPGLGRDYPFSNPSDDIRFLFGDFYLSFEHDALVPTLPLRVAWLFGFGANLVSPPPGYPTPTHDQDLLILDADDQVVFDSTLADEFRVEPWGGRLSILEWLADGATCRATIHTEFSPEMTPIVYDDYIVPDDGELDPRAYERLAPRVRSITANDVVMTGKIDLQSGFNVETVLKDQVLEDGGRLTRRFVLSASPGQGLGRQPGCEDLAPELRAINDIGPDAKGSFFLTAKDCYRLQAPVRVIGVENRVAVYFHSSLTEEEAKSALELSNDCQPCCDCDYFIRTYAGVRRQWNNWLGIATDAQEARDIYAANRERWLDERDCRVANPLKLILVGGDTGCQTFVGGSYCNVSACCLAPLELRFSFRYFEDGVEVAAPPATVCQQALIEGSSTNGQTPYVLLGEWPVLSAVFSAIDSHTTSMVRFRICVPGCGSGQALRVTITAHASDPDPNPAGEICEIPVVDIPAEVFALWADNMPAFSARAILTRDVPLRP